MVKKPMSDINKPIRKKLFLFDVWKIIINIIKFSQNFFPCFWSNSLKTLFQTSIYVVGNSDQNVIQIRCVIFSN